MKAMIVGLLLASQVHAQHWESPNKSGGRIVLTELKCPITGLDALRAMWTEHQDGKIIEGCWTIYADRVQVVYRDGTRYSYNPAGFDRVEARTPARRENAF